MMKVVIVTGGFDPIHSGHISYFEAAARLGDKLVVGINSDAWLTRKKGAPFMPWYERSKVIQAMKVVDFVMEFNDDGNNSLDCIHKCRLMWPDAELIFANGGDRTADNIPEMTYQDREGKLTFEFGVGGAHKANSSSWILQEWKAPKTERVWGYYRVLHENGAEVKLKELTVDPGKRLSMQRHQDRSEHWFVSDGTATVYTIDEKTTDSELEGIYNKHQHVHIPKTQWHQLVNETDEPLKIIEIQYGTNCIEEDIERL
jgi:D-beta-D-heptose 7-phosphate kinase/D-beta-D-heptose 1-phosphate adenosyltransferase